MNMQERKKHESHGWTKRDTSHIHNVAYLATHDLMACPCGWQGWTPKERD